MGLAAGDDDVAASTRRDLKATQIGDPYRFVEGFLVEEGAFDPGIEFGYFFERKECQFAHFFGLRCQSAGPCTRSCSSGEISGYTFSMVMPYLSSTWSIRL